MLYLKTLALSVAILTVITLASCQQNNKSEMTSTGKSEEVTSSKNEIIQRINLLKDERSQHVIVIAHRSCHQDAPENSIAAVKKCIEMNVDMIEVDVRLTKDGQLVVIHDDTLDRTTNGSGAVSDYTLAEIQALKLKNRAGEGESLTDERPPSLEELLRVAKGKLLINLDLKDQLFEQAYKIVTDLEMSDQILMKMNADPTSPELTDASFIGRVSFMPIIHECDPYYAKNYCSSNLEPVVDDFRPYKPVAYEIVFSNDKYLLDGVPAIRKEGARVWVNTMFRLHSAGRLGIDGVDDPNKVWGTLIDMGADMIQTDYPEQLIQFLEESDRRVLLQRNEVDQ